MRSKIRIIIVGLLVLLLLYGCKKSGDDAGKKEASDTIVFVTLGEVDTLDPHQAYDSSSNEILSNVYDGLINYAGAELTEFAPAVAVNVPSESAGTIRDGGKTYEFTIRKGVTFHNGNDLTPEDVEYTFERALLFDPPGSPNWMMIGALLGVNKIEQAAEKYTNTAWKDMADDNGKIKPEFEAQLIQFYIDVVDKAIEIEGDKVIFRLHAPFPPFLHILCRYSFNGYILDKQWSIEQGLWDGKKEGWWNYHAIKKEDSPLYSKTNGCGPYKMVQWDKPQKKLILERYDDYYQGAAAIRKVVIQVVEEWSTRKAMFEKKEADLVYVDAGLYEQGMTLTNKIVYDKLSRLSLDAGQFNWQIAESSKYIGSGKLDGEGIPSDFFADVNVRKAFLYSFDREVFLNDVMKGLGTIPPSCLIKGLLGYDESIEGYTYDVKKATEYFKKAYNGKLWNVGFKMIITYNNGNVTRQNAAELLAARLSEINPKFKVEPKGMDWPSFLDGFKNMVLPFYLIGWGADYPDPHNFVLTYYHPDGDYGSFYGDNYKKFAATPRNELDGMSFDEIIMKAGTITDDAKRIDLYAKIQKFAVDQAIGMSIIQPTGFIITSDRVKGYFFNAIVDTTRFDYYSLSKE